jgi:hypothetical protein
MTATREHLSGLKLARSIIEENWPADALLEIVDNCIAEAHSAEPVQGEAVEVVGWLHRQGNYTEASSRPLAEDEVSRGWEESELMTVAQHNRIMAAAKPDAELVALLRLCRNEFAGVSMTHNLVDRIDAKLAELQK